jgi:hypothetical protein
MAARKSGSALLLLSRGPLAAPKGPPFFYVLTQRSMLTPANDNAPRFIRAHNLARMISSDLPSLAEAGFAKAGNRLPPPARVRGQAFPDHALISMEHDLFGKPVSAPGSRPGQAFSGSCSDLDGA